jgi:hypothetical protein
MSVPLFMFSIYFGNLAGLIRTFTWGGRKILTISFGGFVSVFVLMKRKSGYIFKKIKVFVQSRPQIEQPMQQQDLQSLYPPAPPQLQNEQLYQRNIVLPPQPPPRQIVNRNEQIALEALLDLSESSKNRDYEVDLLSDLLSNFSIDDKRGGRKNKRKYRKTINHKKTKRRIKKHKKSNKHSKKYNKKTKRYVKRNKTKQRK